MTLIKGVGATLMGVALCTTASAQSSVTLYGSLDADIAYVNKVAGRPLWVQSSGVLSYNYWGIRGSEDLGGGNRAIFTLESGFDIDNGALGEWLNTGSSQGLFNRQAFVGLTNQTYGSVTLGRQYDSTVEYLAPLSLAGKGVNLSAHPFNNDNIGAQYSIANAIRYESPNYAGFHFGGQYGFSNSTSFASGRQWSAGATYENGPLKLAAVYDQLDNNTVGALAGVASADGESIAAQRQQIFGVGANYTLGALTAGVLWTQTKYQHAATADAVLSDGDLRFDNIEVNGVYGLTSSLILVGNYTYTYAKATQSGTSEAPRWHSFGAGADYLLSRRTDVYLAAIYQHATGSTGLSADTELGGTNFAGMLPVSGSHNQLGFATGVRHRF